MNLQHKKAFSLIEVIFAISIIAIIAVVAIPKLGLSLDKANVMKIKSDITLIRNGLAEYRDQMILSNDTTPLSSLEESDSFLFDKILDNPIVSSIEVKSASWSKLSNNTYQVWLNRDESLIFTYNSDDYSFDCDFSIDSCGELTQ